MNLNFFRKLQFEKRYDFSNGLFELNLNLTNELELEQYVFFKDNLNLTYFFGRSLIDLFF